VKSGGALYFYAICTQLLRSPVDHSLVGVDGSRKAGLCRVSPPGHMVTFMDFWLATMPGILRDKVLDSDAVLLIDGEVRYEWALNRVQIISVAVYLDCRQVSDQVL